MSIEPHQTELEDTVDLEAYFAARRAVPQGKKYRIRIDKQHYTVHVHKMTGRQILALTDKTPEKFLLRQKLHQSVEPIGPDQEVDFTASGIERFMTIPNEVTEGEPAQERIQFNVLPADLSYLNSLGLRWEAIVESGISTIVIYEWPVPPGYNVSSADVHVRLTALYPDVQIDMAYFAPALARADGRQVGGLSMCQFDGRQWQQWSRHRTAASAWRPGEDDLSTHMPCVQDWLAAELKK
jgi:hypothetical protein